MFKSALLATALLGASASAAPWATRDGWGHDAIAGYGGAPCYASSAEEHAWRYVCERRKDRR